MTPETSPEFTHATSKRPTITDIARAAGVSIAVVSYALNGRPGVSAATRDRVLRIADEHGWRPNAAARSLRTSSRAVGLALVRGDSAATHPAYFMDFLAGIQDTLAERGMALVLQIVDDHESAAALYKAWWAERRFDALLVTDVQTDDPRIKTLRSLRIPAVAICHPQAARGLACVWVDEEGAYARVGEYLAGLGHRRIALVTGPANLDMSVRRSRALRTAVEAAGAQAVVAASLASHEAGAGATRRLLIDDHAPSAILFDTDLWAVTALDVARRLRKEVPWDLSIVSANDSAACRLATPSVTTLPHPVVALGKAAARAVLDLLDGAVNIEHQLDIGPLTVRGTTAPLGR